MACSRHLVPDIRRSGDDVKKQAGIAHIDSYLDDLGWDEDDLEVYSLFWEAGYSYVQLLELAEEWNVGEFEAKARAARAIQSGDTSIIDEVIGEGPASTFMTAEEIEAADMKAYEEEFGLSADSCLAFLIRVPDQADSSNQSGVTL